MTLTAPLTIDVISDIMCPWCYIGKRRLEKALAMTSDIAVEVHWRPYQLDPTLPPEGKDRQQYLVEKFGAERATSFYETIRAAGADEGIDFAFDKIKISPNTMNCHRLIKWARADNLQEAVVERLFQLYFLEGADLSAQQTLIDVAQEVGMEHDLVEQLLPTDSDTRTTASEIKHAQEMGVTGVPCFIIDKRFALMGAENADTLAAAIRHAEETRSAPTSE